MSSYLRRFLKVTITQAGSEWHVDPNLFDDTEYQDKPVSTGEVICFSRLPIEWGTVEIQSYCEAFRQRYTRPGAIEVLSDYFEPVGWTSPAPVPEEGPFKELHCEAPRPAIEVRFAMAQRLEIGLKSGELRWVPRDKSKAA